MTDDGRSAKSRKLASDNETVSARGEPIPASIWEEIDRLRGDAILVAPDDPPPEDVVL
jgi:hypothetical protein